MVKIILKQILPFLLLLPLNVFSQFDTTALQRQPDGDILIYYEKSSGKSQTLSGSYNKTTDAFERGTFDFSTDVEGLVYEITTNGTKQTNPARISLAASTRYAFTGLLKADPSKLLDYYHTVVRLRVNYNLEYRRNGEQQARTGEQSVRIRLQPLDVTVPPNSMACKNDTFSILVLKRPGVQITPRMPTGMRLVRMDSTTSNYFYYIHMVATVAGNLDVAFNLVVGNLSTTQTCKIEVFEGASSDVGRPISLRPRVTDTITITQNRVTYTELYSLERGLNVRRDTLNGNRYFLRATEEGDYILKARVHACRKYEDREIAVTVRNNPGSTDSIRIQIRSLNDTILCGSMANPQAVYRPIGARLRWVAYGDIQIVGADTTRQISLQAKRRGGQGRLTAIIITRSGRIDSISKTVRIGPFFKVEGMDNVRFHDHSVIGQYYNSTSGNTQYVVQKGQYFYIQYKLTPYCNVAVTTSPQFQGVTWGRSNRVNMRAGSNGDGWVRFAIRCGDSTFVHEIPVKVVEITRASFTANADDDATVDDQTLMRFSVNFRDSSGADITQYVSYQINYERTCTGCNSNAWENKGFLIGRTDTMTVSYQADPTRYSFMMVVNQPNVNNVIQTPMIAKFIRVNVRRRR